MNSDAEIFREVTEALESGEPVMLATVVRTRGSTPRKAGAKMLVRRDGRAIGTICGGCVEAEVYAKAMELFGSSRSEVLSFTLNDDAAAELGLRCGGVMEVYLEEITPKPRLYAIGAGHICEDLARFAVRLGFEVHVIDDHPGFLTPERFPSCELHCVSSDRIAALVPRGSHIAAVIATRGHKQDAAALHALIEHEIGYFGLVTSRKRVMEFYRPLMAKGISEERLRRIKAPVGLDIGAKTPPEIALAIMAEILAAFRSAESRSLSGKFWETEAAKKLPALAAAERHEVSELGAERSAVAKGGVQ